MAELIGRSSCYMKKMSICGLLLSSQPATLSSSLLISLWNAQKSTLRDDRISRIGAILLVQLDLRASPLTQTVKGLTRACQMAGS